MNPPVVVPVTPAPMIQKYCKPVSSIPLKKLGVSSANPLKLSKGPLKDVLSPNKNYFALDDVEQLDSTVFQIDLVDEDGQTNTYTIVVSD
jgi:hypothetical protein